MTPELKQKWLDALRNGKYKQGESYLRNRDNKYCCLGVLCEVANYDWKEEDKYNYSCLAGIYFIENDEELEKLGLPKEIMEKAYNKNDGTSGWLKTSFSEIADWLEKENF